MLANKESSIISIKKSWKKCVQDVASDIESHNTRIEFAALPVVAFHRSNFKFDFGYCTNLQFVVWPLCTEKFLLSLLSLGYVAATIFQDGMLRVYTVYIARHNNDHMLNMANEFDERALVEALRCIVSVMFHIGR